MKKNNLFGYYAFGYNYALLCEGLISPPANRQKMVELLEKFLNALADLDVQVANKIAQPLGPWLQRIQSVEDDELDSTQCTEIFVLLKKLDSALDAELQLKYAYILTKKRYSIELLLETPEQLFGEGVYASMTELAQRDFRLACVQVAYSQPTASAFHLMRSLEEMVKVLYFSFKKTNRLKTPMWGPMTRELREKRSPKPSEKLLNHLDGMRIHFRNPTQHPDAFYTVDEAQDLLNQTITAINMVVSELPKPTARHGVNVFE